MLALSFGSKLLQQISDLDSFLWTFSSYQFPIYLLDCLRHQYSTNPNTTLLNLSNKEAYIFAHLHIKSTWPKILGGWGGETKLEASAPSVLLIYYFSAIWESTLSPDAERTPQKQPILSIKNAWNFLSWLKTMCRNLSLF